MSSLDPNATKTTGSARCFRWLIELLGLLGQHDEGHDAEGGEEREEQDDVDPVVLCVDVVAVDQSTAVVARGCGVGTTVEREGELGEDDKVHRVLETAEILCPAEENGDQTRANEEAHEEHLRDKQEWGEFCDTLDVTHGTTHHDSDRARTHAERPGCEHDEDEVTAHTHQKVTQNELLERLDEVHGDLHEELREEIGKGGVSARTVLAEKHGAFVREGEHDGLSGAEHRRDHDHRDRSEVRGEVRVIRIVATSSVEEDEPEEQAEDECDAEAADESSRVALRVHKLAIRQGPQLLQER